jgi:hypothetical protein
LHYRVSFQVCATVGTQHWIYAIENNQIKSLFTPWYYKDTIYGTQQGGFLTQFSNTFSFATVHFAGHEVPAYQPEKALWLFKGYLNSSIFHTSSSSDTDSSSSSTMTSSPPTSSHVVPIVLGILLAITAIGGLIVCFLPKASSSSSSSSSNPEEDGNTTTATRNVLHSTEKKERGFSI